MIADVISHRAESEQEELVSQGGFAEVARPVTPYGGGVHLTRMGVVPAASKQSLERLAVGRDQKVAQNVSMSTNVSSRDSSEEACSPSELASANPTLLVWRRPRQPEHPEPSESACWTLITSTGLFYSARRSPFGGIDWVLEAFVRCAVAPGRCIQAHVANLRRAGWPRGSRRSGRAHISASGSSDDGFAIQLR